MPSRGELTAEIERLPEGDREAIHEAVSRGRAVEEARLAPLAAGWAVARRQHVALICFGILGPFIFLAWWVVDWLVRRDDPDQSSGAVLVGGYVILGAVSLLTWVLMWRPLVKAEKANLESVDASSPRATRVASDWLSAWGLAFVIGSIIRLVLDPLEVSLGPLRIILVALLAWTIKLRSDKRVPEA